MIFFSPHFNGHILLQCCISVWVFAHCMLSIYLVVVVFSSFVYYKMLNASEFVYKQRCESQLVECVFVPLAKWTVQFCIHMIISLSLSIRSIDGIFLLLWYVYIIFLEKKKIRNQHSISSTTFQMNWCLHFSVSVKSSTGENHRFSLCMSQKTSSNWTCWC